MHIDLEKAAAILLALRRQFLSPSDFESTLFLGIVVVTLLATLASCTYWFRKKQKKKRRLLLERELHRVEEWDDMGNPKTMTVVEAFRIRFPGGVSPQEKTGVADPGEIVEAEPERKVGGERRA